MTSIPHAANFGARFCNELSINKNCICSPLSVETVLALVALGSSNQARAEIFKALDIPDEDNLRSTFISLATTLSLKEPSETSKASNHDTTLKIANKIYVKQGKPLKTTTKEDAQKVFQCSLEQIDFTKSSEAANAINSWVANETNNIIKDIVSTDMLNKDTGLVLVNAIYFHGFWEFPFPSKDTSPRKFYVNNNRKIQVKMMTSLSGKRFNYKHTSGIEASILQMFYVGGKASMVIVLPHKVQGLSDVMKRLAAGYDVMADIKSLRKTHLKVVMPKFKAETEIDLKKLLPKMGIKTIFDRDKSDINMLSSNDPLFVSEAVQKTYIAVDEMGTEAAASTCAEMRRCCAEFWEEEFLADHPFLYIITANEIPIFYGIFYGDGNPQQNLLQQWFRKTKCQLSKWPLNHKQNKNQI